MGGRDYPVRFTPRGLVNAFDSTDAFPGACRMLQNLIFDQANPELVVARPGVGDPFIDLVGQNGIWGGPVAWGTPGLLWGATSFSSPTVISVQICIGNFIYGMVATSHFPGFDEPFVFEVGVGFVTITGVTGLNVPLTQSTSGDWTPPTMAVIGAKLIITHPGFTFPICFGIIDLSNPLAPTWTAQNTTGHGLPSVPTSVQNFNNRAWYACGNQEFYSDVLAPDVMTNAGQALTVGDTTPIQGQSGLPITTTSAGVVAALIVFKQFQIWQIVGDAAITGSLAINFLSLNLGTLSPNTIVQTPIGTLFIGIDGPYVVNPLGGVGPLTKDQTKLVQDVQVPFQKIVNPGRAVAAFTGSIYRVCIETVLSGATTTADYWFDITRRRWTGPHTFPYDTISQFGNTFLISSRYVGAQLFLSDYIPDASAIYVDNGIAETSILQSSSLPKTENINEKQVVESTIEIGSIANNATYFINALGEDGATINSTQIQINNPNLLWGGGVTWGSGAAWSSSVNTPKTKTIPWTAPVVFKKFELQITVQSASNLSIGTFFAKYQDTGYTNQQLGS